MSSAKNNEVDKTCASTPCFMKKKLDPLLFHHIFALTDTNCMKISTST